MFQDAQWKANFRARRRFEWRLSAKASRTLRKYGFCRADPWTRQEAAIAEELLQALDEDRRIRKARLAGPDAMNDPDFWCWESAKVPYPRELWAKQRELHL